MPIYLATAEEDTVEDQPAPLMTLERIRDSMRNTKHLAQTLVGAKIKRHYFDPANPEDRIVYMVFARTGKWLKQYYFEMPDTNAVAMCQRRMLEWATRDEADRVQTLVDGINAAKSKAA